ncbi:hypothetical protein AXF42_Ash008808 [Apostasia shenzhenica]|uniref:Uncharacterized protein n=1 Tax=Apostasia shenzhenica TaxID=1088818 RepID=A0A2I0ASJ2_9ASPA|nr:hypothetical protein AXF42_Ash008808 [Apostasia shenzhenica]
MFRRCNHAESIIGIAQILVHCLVISAIIEDFNIVFATAAAEGDGSVAVARGRGWGRGIRMKFSVVVLLLLHNSKPSRTLLRRHLVLKALRLPH